MRTTFIVEGAPQPCPTTPEASRRIALATADLLDTSAIALIEAHRGLLVPVSPTTTQALRSTDPESAFASGMILSRAERQEGKQGLSYPRRRFRRSGSVRTTDGLCLTCGPPSPRKAMPPPPVPNITRFVIRPPPPPSHRPNSLRMPFRADQDNPAPPSCRHSSILAPTRKRTTPIRGVYFKTLRPMNAL